MRGATNRGGGTPPPLHLTMQARAESVVEVRRAVRRSLQDWGAEDLEWAASQLVTELATNAVLHAVTEFEVLVVLHRDRLRCEVADSSPRSPRARHFSQEATTGRGMLLVSELASTWGVVPRAGGKSVWFELVCDSGPPQDDVEDAGAGEERPPSAPPGRAAVRQRDRTTPGGPASGRSRRSHGRGRAVA